MKAKKGKDVNIVAGVFLGYMREITKSSRIKKQDYFVKYTMMMR